MTYHFIFCVFVAQWFDLMSFEVLCIEKVARFHLTLESLLCLLILFCASFDSWLQPPGRVNCQNSHTKKRSKHKNNPSNDKSL